MGRNGSVGRPGRGSRRVASPPPAPDPASAPTGPGDPTAPTDALALLPEPERFCPGCLGPVGRGRDGRPGALHGRCPWCRRDFDLRPHLHPGAVLTGWHARWTVVGLLARGGRAWLHRVVDAAGDPGVLTRVRGHGPEAGVLAAEDPARLLALRVPGLVGVHDVVDGPGPWRHLVLHHVEGTSPRPPLEPAAAARRAGAAASAVAGLHVRGLLHADLKPPHLLAGPAGVTLVDLGGVRDVADRTSAVWGTDGFLAPEIVPGGAGPSRASDVWALGATLAALLAGGPDVPGRERRARIETSGWRDLVAAATHEDPARRPDAEVLARRLSEPGDRSGPSCAGRT